MASGDGEGRVLAFWLERPTGFLQALKEKRPPTTNRIETMQERFRIPSTARWPFWLIRAIGFVPGIVAFAAGASLEPTQLRCEYLPNPLGIDTVIPRLSWVVESKQRAQKQTAYQVLVASTESGLKSDEADLWDSGKVESDRSFQIVYSGQKLHSRQRCCWKVRVWDKEGKASDYSKPAFWEMGLLSPGDWHAEWIGQTKDIESRPAPMLRRGFLLDGKIKSARAYICGLGYYELDINGKRVGDHVLDPGYTRYDKRALYVTYDVTEDVRNGKNALGVILGNGWYNVQTKAVWNFHKAPWRAAPKLLMQLEVEYADGRSQSISTDTQWKTSTGPILFDSIYGGETYDARLEKPDWTAADFDDSGWASAIRVEPPLGKLAAQMMPPIKADEIIKPVKITEPRPGHLRRGYGAELRRIRRVARARACRREGRDEVRRTH